MSHNPQIKTAYTTKPDLAEDMDRDPLMVNETYRARKNRFEQVLARVSLPFDWTLCVVHDEKSLVGNPRFFLCVHATDDMDVRTGQRGYAWNGREWFLSEAMTDSQILRAAYLAVRGAVEHEFNESFLIDGARPFDPHIDLVKQAEFAGSPNNADQP